VGSGTLLVSPDGFNRASRSGFHILNSMRVDLRGAGVLVAEEFLGRSNVCTLREEGLFIANEQEWALGK
jgi:hypothetical protein